MTDAHNHGEIRHDDPTIDHPGAGDSATSRGSGELSEGPGSQIGPYRLLQLIGEGGFGSVFMAEQEKPVSRKVALKIIKLGMDTRQVVARFEQERQALAMMDHPNIARVLDAGATSTGRPYFVMELVKGDPIVEFCDKGKLTISDRLELFAQVCTAVQHAHTKGIIHRDIKPSNILVSSLDGRPSAKVIDFGIAKATATKLTEKTLFTEHRQLIGTPEYMSPEQAEGSLDIDTRTDVYSLGVLLYELLTGTTPFSGKELRSAAYAEIQRIIREVDPPKPSTRISQNSDTVAGVAALRHTEPRRLGTQIRGELDWIVMKALEKDRQRRYETANGLAMDIRRYLAGEAVLAAPPSASYRMRKFVNRNRGQVIAAALVSVALVFGLIGTAWQATRAAAQRDIASEQRDRALAAEAEATKRAGELAAVSEFQASMLDQIDPTAAGTFLMSHIRDRYAAALEKEGLTPADRDEKSSELGRELDRLNATDVASALIDRTILKPAVEAIGEKFKDQPLVNAKLRLTLARVYTTLGFYEPAKAQGELSLATSRQAAGDRSQEAAASRNDLAMIVEAMGDEARGETLYREAYEIRKEVLGPDHAETLQSMGNLGNLLRNKGDAAGAEPLLRACLDGYRRVLGPDKRETLIAMNTLGFLYIQQGKTAEAEPLWREAYERGLKALGPDNRDVLIWTNNLAGLLQSQGKFNEAEPLFLDVLEKHRRIVGEEHPSTIHVTGIVADHYSKRGQYDKAEPLAREALEKSRRVLGNEHPSTLARFETYASLLRRQGRFAEAEALFRQLIEARTRVRGPEHRETLSAMGGLADVLVNQGRLAEAEALYRTTLERSRRTLGDENPPTLVTKINLANVLMQKGSPAEAEPLIREVIEVRRRVSGEEHPETLIAIGNLVAVIDDLGRRDEAEAMSRDVTTRLRKALGDSNPSTLNSIAYLAAALNLNGKAAEAEPLAREAIAGFEKQLGKDNVRTASARLTLGRALTTLGRLEEAEAALVEADRALGVAQGVTPKRRRQCCEALVSLYEAWEKSQPGKGYDAKAAQWKSQVDALIQNGAPR